MPPSEIAPVITTDAIKKISLETPEGERFGVTLKSYFPVFRKKDAWQAEWNAMPKGGTARALAKEDRLDRRWRAVFTDCLEKRLGRTINMATAASYTLVIEAIERLADQTDPISKVFKAENVNFNMASFINCCLDRMGIAEKDNGTPLPVTDEVIKAYFHFDKARLDPQKEAYFINQLKVQPLSRTNLFNDLKLIGTSDRATRLFIANEGRARIHALTIVAIDQRLGRAPTKAELKLIEKISQDIIKVAQYCDLKSDKLDVSFWMVISDVLHHTGATLGGVEYPGKMPKKEVAFSLSKGEVDRLLNDPLLQQIRLLGQGEIPPTIRITARDLGIPEEKLKTSHSLAEEMSIKTNLNQFRKWIEVVRDKIKMEGERQKSSLLLKFQDPDHPELFHGPLRLDERNQRFDHANIVMFFADRYGLPLAIYGGDDLSGIHAEAVLKVNSVTVKDGTPVMQAVVYNPLVKGDNPIKITEILGRKGEGVDYQNPKNWYYAFNIIANPPAYELFQNQQYNFTTVEDLFMLANPKIATLKQADYQALMGDFSLNCVPFATLNLLARVAAKFRKNDPEMPPTLKFFYEKGLDRFSQDWKLPVEDESGKTVLMPFHIATRDDFEGWDGFEEFLDRVRIRK